MITRLETAMLFEPNANRHLLVLVGRLDHGESHKLELALRLAVTDPGASWFVDVSQLSFADSALIKFLEHLAQILAANACLKVVPTPTTDRLLDLFDLTSTVGPTDEADPDRLRSATSSGRRDASCRGHRSLAEQILERQDQRRHDLQGLVHRRPLRPLA